MDKTVITVIAIVLFSTMLKGQEYYSNYTDLWQEVEQLESEKFPKSALNVVEKIYAKAKKEQNTPQLTKSLIYTSKYLITLEEDAQLEIVKLFQREIAVADFPTKNILESVLANLYWQYFQQNRYQFYDRTKTNVKVDPTDFRTWDLQTLFREIHIHFQHSLKIGLLAQQTGLEKFDAILELQKDSKTYRPTLFDFLNHNALEFYKTTETSITNPSYKFEISKKEFLADFNIFSALTIQSKDSLSLQLNALNIYQKLGNFHNEKNTAAFITIELERLKFVQQFATFQGKDAIFLKSLYSLKDRFSSAESSTLIDFEIAEVYNNQANEYLPLTSIKNQFKRTKALAICNDAIHKYPKSAGAEKCQMLKQEIQRKSLSILTEKHQPIKQHGRMLISYKNIEKLYFKIYKIDEKENDSLKKIYNEEAKIEFINKLDLIDSFNKSLKTENDYQTHTIELVIPPLYNGHYLMYASTFESLNPASIYATSIIQTTDIALIENNQNDINIFQVVHRNTGKPLVGAKVNFKNYNTGRFNNPIIRNYTADRNGELKFRTTASHSNVLITVRYKDEIAYFGDFYLSENKNLNTKPAAPTIQSFLFTDRSIYRPGQSAYFKGIFIERAGSVSTPFSNQMVTAALYNVNNEKITTLDLKTNEFGSVSGAFILPNNGLLGQYSIRLSTLGMVKQSFYFSVEEYKRPKFEVAFKPVTNTYRINDGITVKGSAIAFSGNTISDAKIVYRVHRKIQYPRWFYWYHPNFILAEPQEITHGESVTDALGNFNINFKALPDNNVEISDSPIFTYEIEAAVTDINGETRRSKTRIKVGYHALTARIIVPDRIDKNHKENFISIELKNLNDQVVSARGNIKIYKLLAPSNVLRKRPWPSPDYQLLSKEEFRSKFPHEAFSNEDNAANWEKGKLVFESQVDSSNASKIELKRINKWFPGKYIVELEVKDSFGQTVSDKKLLTVFSKTANKVADNQLFVIETDKKSYIPNENVCLKIGSASGDVHVTIDIEKDHHIIESKFIQLNNEVKFLKIPVTEKDFGGFAIHYSFTNFNSFENGIVSISVPYPVKELAIETLTFRDKLKPGQDETWSFKLKGSKGDKVAAELLASMYDASLDQFKSHEWQFTPIQQPNYYSYTSRNASRSFGNTYFSLTNLPRYDFNYTQQYFDKLNWFGFHFNNYRVLSALPENISGIKTGGNNNERIKVSAVELQDKAVVPVAELDEVIAAGNEEKKEYALPLSEDTLDFSSIKIRKNFNETAFFFPHLTTDISGNVSFVFTVPEVLTVWKLQLLGHTKELASITKIETAVTQKELMVIPNPPRFLREGDEILFSSKISNLTDKAMRGLATLELTDAITGESIDQKLANNSSSQQFSIDRKGNTNVSWALQIPDAIRAVNYKIMAKAGDFSDGEQGVLPVLSNRMLVTETLPMWIRGNQSKKFTLDKLKNNTSRSLKNHKLTLEITANPAWYALQSLPYLMEYPFECSEQTFSRYYGNALASHIVNSNPGIQEVFNQWKSGDALLSNLEKNPELKSIMIQETPWLFDSQSETAQKKRMALLFDLNKMNNELQTMIHKLKQQQFSNGGFPWFKGSPYPNRFITQHIATGFGHLNKLGVNLGKHGESSDMISRAVQFLDAEILADYNNLLNEANKLKEKEKTEQKGTTAEKVYLAENHLGHSQLQYLYMRSFYAEIPISKKVQNAIDYYTGQSAKYWKNFDLFSEGLIALIQYRNGNHSLANAILNSLQENSIVSEELGMYWKENVAGWYWYQSPIETQALLIEAFTEIQNNNATIDALKVWLLKNKQTNRWKTSKATTYAIYALLLQGSDWLAINETLGVTVGSKNIEPSKLENVPIEAGSGYFKTSWNGNEIMPAMGDVRISKKDEGISWGGLYWQYFEDLDKISFAKTPLNLSKKLFLKTNVETGQQLTEISEISTLKVGDLLTVRIELKVDRAMEFIHMKDMRASGLEPVNVVSQYKWQDGLGYYESTKDASTNFFMEYLPKGVYVFEYDLYVNNAGNFSNGITTIQSVYAPEFSSHSEGVRILVD